MTDRTRRRLFRIALLGATTLASAAVAAPQPTNVTGNNGQTPLPTGQFVTPQVIPGFNQQDLNPGLAAHPNFVADEAVRAQLSPDGSTLAIITAGYNDLVKPNGASDPSGYTQYIFLYDVTGGNKTVPVLRQVIHQSNAHVGLVWASATKFYATGGADDAVYAYTGTAGGSFTQSAKIALGHGANGGLGLGVYPNASGIALSADGNTLVVANNYNDSISVINTASNTVRYEQDLRPYANEGTAGVAGGEYPIAVAIKGNTAYVGSYRDRQIVAVDVSGSAKNPNVTRITLAGNPNGMTFDAAQANLYVAQENVDEVAVVDTASNAVVANIDTRAPAGLLTGPHYTGAAPFATTISNGVLYVVNSGSNSIAVIPLSGPGAGAVAGLIPTAYAPKDVAFSADGSEMYIINGKSDSGPTPYLTGGTPYLANTTYPGGNAAAYIAVAGQNTYQFNLEHATLVSGSVPTAVQLAALTTKVASNNFYTAQLSSAEQAEIAALQAQIKHVIYIVKENRTFDQILGDLANGADADPAYAVFGKRITPNFHLLATNFVTLDNSFDAADGSMDGWSLATRGLVTTTEEITQQINYGGHGLAYETEGSNRNVPVGVATEAARDTATGGAYTTAAAGLPGGPANLLPGLANVTSPDAPFGIQKGFIYDAVLAAGKTVRNYGFLVNNIGAISNASYPGGFTHPGPDGANVVQVAPVDPDLIDKTDLYFRGFDQNVPDLWRFNEWNREFQAYAANGQLPSLETVRFSHDHMGGLGTAQAGMVSPEQEQADDDYTVGKLVDTVAHSPYASNTLIIVTEDDSQDGPDHVDSHRTTTYVAGPFVKKHAIVSVRYNMVSILRTIEDILGTPHMNLNTAYQRPMLEVFDTSLSNLGWTYSATASTVLKTTTLISANESGVRYAEGPDVVPTHDRAYWAKATAGFDFSDADRIPHDLFNRVVWEGVMGGQPYPERAVSATSD